MNSNRPNDVCITVNPSNDVYICDCRKQPRLEELNLRDCSLEDDGAVAVAEYVLACLSCSICQVDGCIASVIVRRPPYRAALHSTHNQYIPTTTTTTKGPSPPPAPICGGWTCLGTRSRPTPCRASPRRWPCKCVLYTCFCMYEVIYICAQQCVRSIYPPPFALAYIRIHTTYIPYITT